MYGKMKNTKKALQPRVKVNFSVDKGIEKTFSEQADRLAINKSALIEKFMQRWTQENKDRDA